MQDTSFASNGPGPAFWLVCIFFVVFEIASLWQVFEKAGKPGWACLIPIYNAIVLCQIAGKPAWWVLLYLIPFVNIVISIIVKHNISRNFGHDVGFTLGLIFLPVIFYPILAWGDSEYQQPMQETHVPV